MANPPPRRYGWPILVGAIIAGVSGAGMMSMFWGVSFLPVLIFFLIISVLVVVNWLIIRLLDRWRAR